MLSIVAAIGFAGLPHAVSAVTTVTLPLTGFGRILVDPATSQVFVSSPADSAIVVLDLNGNVKKKITGESGANAMAISGSTLYVALMSGGQIDRIDTTTLTDTGVVVSGLNFPTDLAYAGSKLWLIEGVCSTSPVKFGSVDPSAITPTFTDYTSSMPFGGCMGFARNHAANPSFVLVYQNGVSPPTIAEMDVSATPPVVLASQFEGALQFLRDVAINPDGTHFTASPGASETFDEFNLSDLSADGVVYPANTYPDAIDTSSANGGILVGGMNNAIINDLYAYQIGRPQYPLVALNNGTSIAQQGIAISPDGLTAYAVVPSSPVTLELVQIPPAPPPGSPGPPTGVTAAAGVGSVYLTWTAPSDIGAGPITGYKITSSGGQSWTVGAGVTSATIAGLAPSNHTFTVRATNSSGTGVSSAPSNSVTPNDGGTYHPLTPTRILDTRNGLGGVPKHPVSPGPPLALQVLGTAGVPATGVSAVVLNLTAANPAGVGWITVYPAGATRPVVSNLNYTAGRTVPNLVQVAVGTGGQIDIAVAGASTDLIADMEGWFGDSTDSYGASGLLIAGPPTRILDTRHGTGAPQAKLGPGVPLVLQVTGRGSIPSTNVEAVVLNVTVTNPTQAGWLTVYPSDQAQPLASNLNFRAGQTVANRVIVPVSASGQVSIVNSSGYVDVIADASSWVVQNGTGGTSFVAVVPGRLFDTRGCKCKLGPGYVLDLALSPKVFIVTLALNVTATNTTSTGYLTLYPDDGSFGGGPPPLASDLNFGPRQTVANADVLSLNIYNEAFNTYNPFGWTDVLIDVDGYYGSGASVQPAGQVILQANEPGRYLPLRRSLATQLPARLKTSRG